MKERVRTARFGGVTLIELLVAMGLLALIMVLLSQVLIPGLGIWKHARAVADIEQQAMVAEDRIARTVLASIGGSIQSTSTAALQAVGMLGHGGSSTEQGFDSLTGEPDWDRVEIFYVRPSDGILYQTSRDETTSSLPYDFDDGAFRLTPAQLATLAGTTGPSLNRLAEKVTQLSLTPDENEDPPIVGEGFVLRLALETTVPKGKKSIERQVYLVPRLRERQ